MRRADTESSALAIFSTSCSELTVSSGPLGIKERCTQVGSGVLSQSSFLVRIVLVSSEDMLYKRAENGFEKEVRVSEDGG